MMIKDLNDFNYKLINFKYELNEKVLTSFCVTSDFESF